MKRFLLKLMIISAGSLFSSEPLHKCYREPGAAIDEAKFFIDGIQVNMSQYYQHAYVGHATGPALLTNGRHGYQVDHYQVSEIEYKMAYTNYLARLEASIQKRKAKKCCANRCTIS